MQHTLFQRLLEYFDITEEDYNKLIAPVTISNFANGHRFDKIDEASDFVHQVINNNGKIFIYGDYDADGVMGTSILVKMFSYVNVKADYYLPNRYLDGYGLTLKKAQEVIDNKYDLVITVDNGISAFEAIKLLKDNGIKILVLDHHQRQDELPVADYIIHPEISNFGEISSSGAFVAFMFSIEFLGYFDKYLSTLAAISVVSDMMPLKEYNRNLLRLVFQNYINGEFLPIDLLKDKEEDPFNEMTIGMNIAPKINAIGRLVDNESINNLVIYFTSEDKDEILNYITWIKSTNDERKSFSKSAVNDIGEFSDDASSIVVKMDVKEGLLGLIANHLCSLYHVPVVVLTKDSSDDALKGSCRAPDGFNVVDAFNQCGDILITSGGHALAGGCSLLEKDFETFKNKFEEICKNTKIVPPEENPIHLGVNEINLDSYNLINSFSPFGEGWKAPSFFLRRIRTSALMWSRSGEHILTQISFSSRLVGFSFRKEDVQQYLFVDMIGRLRTNVYRGNTNVEFSIKEIKES